MAGLFNLTSERFFESDRTARDLFLDRSGVRYRVLPDRLAAGSAPLVKVPDYSESFLYDWGPQVAPRASVVESVTVVADPMHQITALFTAGWNSRDTALIDREVSRAGVAGASVGPFARIVSDQANRVVVEAGAGDAGGYLVLLDSFSDDWRVTVDGALATLVRANGLFRGVRLASGQHTVEFRYRPRGFVLGATVSAVALVTMLGLGLAARTSTLVRWREA